MNSNRHLAPAAYLVAALLVFIPLFDAALSLYPFNTGSSQWRFGAFGLFSNALMLPASGALVAVVAAAAASHPRMLRVLRIASWLVAVVLVVGTALFALDAVQSRQLIRPEMQLSYMVATLTAAAKLVLAALAFVLLGRGAAGSERGLASEARTDAHRAFGKRNSGALASH